jgi:predicted nucleic acid-binding protein
VIVVDTTILVYAVGADHPLAEPSRRLLSALAQGRIEASTTTEVIQEFVHVRARRRDRLDAAQLGRAYAELFAPLLSVTTDDLTAGLRLFEGYPALSAFDAVLAAVTIARGAEALVSADAAFSTVPTLAYVDPATSALEALLSG